ncbi:putative proline/alanine-rich repetetive membrane anchored protein [Pseudoxanthomonas suwonensis 11-1]|uniref:Putative proline/alanine-rich repetetive membrane anchored protein n=1 Tax=Pseudoxanthomonas suwonensis (strain 11-1) TaxID=743721 RepID=E6WSH4_PSEUU|nr:hypothetical protein [Pseudoxanthomonas suwonensis]ADV27188.1 putative proline/alanine-rich repetetive membrane anchored protein [Pseudoxanthomonas suwonensis 11-1]
MSRREPLTPEELELQRQLEATAGPGPSPGIDARILAAARAQPACPATTAPAARSAAQHRRRPRRWIAPLGLAASLVLAFGVAWQLREPPRPGQMLPVREQAGTSAPAQPAATPLPAESAGAAESAVLEDASPQAEEAAQAMPATAGNDGTDRSAGGASAKVRNELQTPPPLASGAASFEPPAPPPPPPPPPPFAAVADEVVPLPSPPAPPAPQPAEVAGYAEAARMAEEQQDRAREARDSEREHARRARQQRELRAARPATAVAAPAQALPAPALAPVHEAQPPPSGVVVAFPHDPQAWLEWIRDLQAQGDIAGARASLEWFVRDYPQLEVPDDLRPLLPQTD